MTKAFSWSPEKDGPLPELPMSEIYMTVRDGRPCLWVEVAYTEAGDRYAQRMQVETGDRIAVDQLAAAIRDAEAFLKQRLQLDRAWRLHPEKVSDGNAVHSDERPPG